ncbi:L,D-transpeptidase catalytic domain [Formosa sp. Hel1_31_208]|uniref:L,D-transpeptidase n=1 Tax=Formosa sp. Hel1_31_208 TaxID=1798225 RepID=UPI00087B92E9|nr:L,D-transpeptidase [Formosa sp. Hel1_31_208]SDS19088.1 L,D-transpeptidase catalytic domain [Formosa sp. Hel1_31_208]
MNKFNHHLLQIILIVLVFKFWYYQKASSIDSATINCDIHERVRLDSIKVKRTVIIKDYFQYLDSIVTAYDSLTPYPLSEHLLVRANPWILDTLQNTDYYRMKARDSFIYDQKQMAILPKEAVLYIPDSLVAAKILHAFKNTLIDINIPEYKLRIFEDSILLHEFSVRVGRHEKKYLEMSGKIEDLRTKTGEGLIVNYNRNPRYVNPANNKEYKVTRRDDDKVTKLPQIPFIETEINSLRHGQLIHPTTNPKSLGKAYSNGCIGTSEADAWVIYYYAPINTKINIRYDLTVVNTMGDTVVLKDIYNKNKK